MKQLLVIALLLVASSSSAQRHLMFEGADESIRLWDNSTAKYSNHESRDEERERGKRNVFVQTSSCDLYIYKAEPEKNSGICVVILPGGGYAKVHISDHTARWFASQGITAAVVKYRLPNYGHYRATLEDAAGAIRYMRSRSDLGIDASKVGVFGISAGGHLAAWVSNVMPDNEKPAFAIPVSASITRTEFYTTVKANQHLMGKEFCYSNAEALSVQNMVTSQTPPTLLLLCDDDLVVPSHSSTTYYEALINNGVVASMHIYPEGGHGIGAYTKEFRAAILDWLGWLGLIK